MKFNLTRFANLVRRDFITHRKALMYGVAGIIGLFLIISFGAVKTNHGHPLDYDFWIGWYGILLLGGGLILTSMIFREFKTPSGRIQYLSLPASNLEKLSSRLIYSLILYPAFLSLVVYCCAQFTVGPNEVLEGENKEVVKILWRIFVALRSLVFLFAVTFNKFVAPKAILITLALSILVTMFTAGMFYLIFNEHFDNGLRHGPNINMRPNDQLTLFAENTLLPFLDFGSKYLIAPFFWVVAYFKMREKEA